MYVICFWGLIFWSNCFVCVCVCVCVCVHVCVKVCMHVMPCSCLEVINSDLWCICYFIT